LISGFGFSSTLSGAAGLEQQKNGQNRAISQNPLCSFGYRVPRKA
jgi:hypothetical protein